MLRAAYLPPDLYDSLKIVMDLDFQKLRNRTFLKNLPCLILNQGTTDLPIKPINRPIYQNLPIIGITDLINPYQAFKMSRANSCTSGIVVGIKIFMLVKDL